MGFEFGHNDDGSLRLEEAVFQALGAASTCWETLEGAGVFDSERAREIGDKLVDFIRAGIPNFSRDFPHDLEHLINAHCCENASNTPDFILATYMKGCLDLFDAAVNTREEWYGRKNVGPGSQETQGL